MEVTVDDPDASVLQIERFDMHRWMMLILNETGVRIRSGKEAVHAEVAIVREVAEVAAICEYLPFGIPRADRVVHPPDAPADQPGILWMTSQHLLQVAGAIAHRVAHRRRRRRGCPCARPA